MNDNERINHFSLNLFLFNEDTNHIYPIKWIIVKQFDYGLLIDISVCGNQLLTELLTHIIYIKFFTLLIIRNYNEREFLENIKILMDLILNGLKLKVFLFSDNYIIK